MKEELEKLGFEYAQKGYYLIIKDVIIEVVGKMVYINNVDEYEGYVTKLFDYNYEKLKQLIQILS